MLTLRLNLEDLARRTGRTRTFHAARAIEERLAEFEKAYQAVPARERDPAGIQAAITALKELRRGVIKPEGMTVREMINSGRA